jgi:hypothetical protein
MMRTHRRNQLIRFLLIVVAGLAVACAAFAVDAEESHPVAPIHPTAETTPLGELFPANTDVLEILAEAPVASPGTLADDVFIQLGDNGTVTNMVLGASVAENLLHLAGAAPNTLDTRIQISGTGNFTDMYGVNTVGLNTGTAAVQNISISMGGTLSLPIASTATQ